MLHATIWAKVDRRRKHSFRRFKGVYCGIRNDIEPHLWEQGSPDNGVGFLKTGSPKTVRGP